VIGGDLFFVEPNAAITLNRDKLVLKSFLHSLQCWEALRHPKSNARRVFRNR
jgi:hypothetical protein